MQTKVIKVDPINPDKEKIKEAVNILSEGGLVAFPTETVYGLAANLLNKNALARLYEVKNRPENKPFSVVVADKEKIEEWAREILPFVYKLIDKFWPGPLTLVLKSKDNTSPASYNGKVGIRMPNHNVALSIIKEAGFPLVLPSANMSGGAPPASAEDVLRDLKGKIDLVVDGGKSTLAKESTVLDAISVPVSILREGAITKDEIDKITSTKTVLFVCTGNSCRSVMAKGLLEKWAKDNKRDDIEVLSAGTHIFRTTATSETIALLKEEGIDVLGYKPTPLTSEMIKRAEIILTMESEQEQEVLRLVLEAHKRVYLLKEFAHVDIGGLEIEDPFGGSSHTYRNCFLDIKEALKRVYELL